MMRDMKGKTAIIIAAVAVVVGVLLWLLVIERAINESRRPSKAAGEPLTQSFFPSAAHALPGEDITVYVHAKAAQTLVIRGYNVELSFDPAVLRFKNISYYVSALSTGLGQTNANAPEINQSGAIRITGESNTAAGFVLTAGYETNVAAVTFTILNSTPTYVRYVKNSNSPKYFAMNADYSIQEITSDFGRDFPVNQVSSSSSNSSSSQSSSSSGQSSSSSSSRSSSSATSQSSSAVSSGSSTSSLSSSSASNSSSQSSSSASAGSSSTSSSQSSSSSGQSSSSSSSRSSSSATSQSPSSSVSSGSSSSIITAGPTDTPDTGAGDPAYEAVLNMRIRLQGVVAMPLVRSPIPVKVRLVGKESGSYDSGPAAVSFTPQADGTWTGAIRFRGIHKSAAYALLLKGPLHLQRKICDLAPADSGITGTNNTFYRCGNTGLSLKEGDNTVDMSKMLLLSGDLPESGAQNGLIDAYDTTFIRQHIQSLNGQDLAIGDLNYDGVIDSQDFSLIQTSIVTKYDEE